MNDHRHELDALLVKIDACDEEDAFEKLLLEYTRVGLGYGPWDWFVVELDLAIENQRRVLRRPLAGPRHLATLMHRFEEINDSGSMVHEEECYISDRPSQLHLQRESIDLVSDPRWNVDDEFAHYAEPKVWYSWRIHEPREDGFAYAIVFNALSDPTLSGRVVQDQYHGTHEWPDLDMDTDMHSNVLDRSLPDLVATHPNTPSAVLDGLIEKIDDMFDHPVAAPAMPLARDDLTIEQNSALRRARPGLTGTAP